jgi:predicted HAD superfamily Cof-like phosphohydrolase
MTRKNVAVNDVTGIILGRLTHLVWESFTPPAPREVLNKEWEAVISRHLSLTEEERADSLYSRYELVAKRVFAYLNNLLVSANLTIDAAANLLDLKTYKTKNGADAYYLDHKAPAWANLRACLSAYQKCYRDDETQAVAGTITPTPLEENVLRDAMTFSEEFEISRPGRFGEEGESNVNLFNRLDHTQRMLASEFIETGEAIEEANLEEIVDGFADQAFLALKGIYKTFRLKGFSPESSQDRAIQVMRNVCGANLAKKHPEKGVQYNESGKVIKPEGWLPPDHSSCFNESFILDK